MNRSHHDARFDLINGRGQGVNTIDPPARRRARASIGGGVRLRRAAWLRMFQKHVHLTCSASTATMFWACLHLDRRFDLAVSQAVAAHRDAAVAPMFVESLVGLAPIVRFSAAIPEQGGVER